MLQEKVRT
jgi:hypothetical protein